MNFWSEKPEFWKSRIAGNATYQKQKAELVQDIADIKKTFGIQTVLDVGGYRGELGLSLPKGLKYRSLDLVNGFDITKPWASQGLVKQPHTLALTSLVAIVLSPSDLLATIDQMQKNADYLLFYEELYDGRHYNGEKISEDYGGKWNHDIRSYLPELVAITTIPSQANEHWERIFVGGIL